MVTGLSGSYTSPYFLKPEEQKARKRINAVMVKCTKNLGAGAEPVAPRFSANAYKGANAFVTTKLSPATRLPQKSSPCDDGEQP
jgi:hypothetical protein